MIDHGHSPSEIAARLVNAKRPGHLRDMVYGGIDGAVTTLAIVAGVEGAGLSPNIIIALGFANVLADGFSMAAGNFAGTRAEAEDIARLRATEERHIDQFPDGEMEELRQILEAKGIGKEDVAPTAAAFSRSRRAWVEVMLTDEYGVSPIQPAPLHSALATFGAFLLAGLVPLLPFLFNLNNAFEIAVIATLGVFLLIGAGRSLWSLRPWWQTALETLAIGGTAALIAFIVGRMFQ